MREEWCSLGKSWKRGVEEKNEKWKSRGKEWGEVEEWETVNTSAFEQEQGDPAADVHVGLVAQSCPTLCNSMDCRPPDSSVHGILQARILE